MGKRAAKKAGKEKEEADAPVAPESAKDAAPAAAADPAAEAAAAEAEKKELIEEAVHWNHSLAIFATIKQSQMQNGLRHEDYRRYREYCARRLHRLRKSLRFTCVKGKQYVKKEVAVKDAKDVRHLLLVLVMAERAWAHYMAIKQVTPLTPHARLHARARLHKAAGWAAKLETLCKDAAEQRTLLEAKAYHAWMVGNDAMERTHWAEAQDRFELARTVCDQLSRVGFPEQQAVFYERLEELTPKLRFCAYHLKASKGAVPEAELAALKREAGPEELKELIAGVVSEAVKQGGEALREVPWKGKQVPIRSEKLRERLATALEAASEAQRSEASTERAKLYEHVFTVLSEAQQVLRDEKASQIRHGVKPEALRDTDMLTEYVAWMRLTNSYNRNSWLAKSQQRKLAEGAIPEDKASMAPADAVAVGAAKKEKPVRPDDIARMYEVALQSATEATALSNDAALQAHTQTLRALRCYYVALTYLADAKNTEAYILLNRTLAHAEKAKASPEIAALTKQAEKFKVIAQARAAAAQQKEKEGAAGPRAGSGAAAPSVEKQPDTFDAAWEERRLVDFPPTMEVVAPRPLLFDLSFTEIEYPSLEARKKPATGAAAAAGGKQKGWFSFWG